jgi:hypothetical protein
VRRGERGREERGQGTDIGFVSGFEEFLVVASDFESLIHVRANSQYLVNTHARENNGSEQKERRKKQRRKEADGVDLLMNSDVGPLGGRRDPTAGKQAIETLRLVRRKEREGEKRKDEERCIDKER